MLWSDCKYAQPCLSLCWLHVPRCWKSHVTVHLFLHTLFSITLLTQMLPPSLTLLVVKCVIPFMLLIQQREIKLCLSVCLSWLTKGVNLPTRKTSSVEFFLKPDISFSRHSLLILLQVRSSSINVVFSSSALASALHPSKYSPFQARFSFFRHVFSWRKENTDFTQSFQL